MSHRRVRMQLPSGSDLTILNTVIREMRRQGLSNREIEEYRRVATSGDYDNLLRVTMEYIEDES